jgi:arylsulfatase A-like enzyme
MDWQRAIQKDGMKLIEYSVNGQRHTQPFNLNEDPHELRNLAEEPAQADALATLRALLRE